MEYKELVIVDDGYGEYTAYYLGVLDNYIFVAIPRNQISEHQKINISGRLFTYIEVNIDNLGELEKPPSQIDFDFPDQQYRFRLYNPWNVKTKDHSLDELLDNLKKDIK